MSKILIEANVETFINSLGKRDTFVTITDDDVNQLFRTYYVDEFGEISKISELDTAKAEMEFIDTSITQTTWTDGTGYPTVTEMQDEITNNGPRGLVEGRFYYHTHTTLATDTPVGSYVYVDGALREVHQAYFKTDTSAYPIAGSENTLGINKDDNTLKKVLDKLALWQMELDSGEAWVTGTVYEPEESFFIVVPDGTNDWATEDGTLLEGGHSYMMQYIATTTSGAIVDATEVVKMGLIGVAREGEKQYLIVNTLPTTGLEDVLYSRLTDNSMWIWTTYDTGTLHWMEVSDDHVIYSDDDAILSTTDQKEGTIAVIYDASGGHKSYIQLGTTDGSDEWKRLNIRIKAVPTTTELQALVGMEVGDVVVVDAGPVHSTFILTTTGTIQDSHVPYDADSDLGWLNIDNQLFTPSVKDSVDTYTIHSASSNSTDATKTLSAKETTWASDGSETTDVWVAREYKEPVILDQVGISFGNTSIVPTTMTIEGSLDGTTWSTLHTISDYYFGAFDKQEQIQFQNGVPFRHYRTNLTIPAAGTPVTINTLTYSMASGDVAQTGTWKGLKATDAEITALAGVDKKDGDIWAVSAGSACWRFYSAITVVPANMTYLEPDDGIAAGMWIKVEPRISNLWFAMNSAIINSSYIPTISEITDYVDNNNEEKGDYNIYFTGTDNPLDEVIAVYYVSDRYSATDGHTVTILSDPNAKIIITRTQDDQWLLDATDGTDATMIIDTDMVLAADSIHPLKANVLNATDMENRYSFRRTTGTTIVTLTVATENTSIMFGIFRKRSLTTDIKKYRNWKFSDNSITQSTKYATDGSDGYMDVVYAKTVTDGYELQLRITHDSPCFFCIGRFTVDDVDNTDVAEYKISITNEDLYLTGLTAVNAIDL